MLKKLKKTLFIYMILFFIIGFTSCYKKERFIFKEGKYEYSEKEIKFYNDIKINYISLNFRIENETNNNIITNRKNQKNYYVDFYIENENKDGCYCTFESQKKVGDQIDRYYINLNISNFINMDNSIANIVLEFYNPNYYQNNQEIEANQIFLSINNLLIDGVNDNNYFFPSRLNLKYVE